MKKREPTFNNLRDVHGADHLPAPVSIERRLRFRHERAVSRQLAREFHRRLRQRDNAWHARRAER